MATQPSGPEAGGGVAGSNKGAVAGDRNDPAVSTDDQALISALALPGDIDAIPRHRPGGRPLTVDGARELTERIKFDAQTLWMQLLRAFEGNAHGALGYDSWHAYCRAELQIEAAQSYRLLNAARVAGFLHSPVGEPNQAPITERVARELTALLDDPEKLRGAFSEASEISRDADGAPKPPTAAVVRQAAQARLAPRPADGSNRRNSKPAPATTVTGAIAELIATINSAAETTVIAAKISEASRVLEKRRSGTEPGALADALRDVLETLAEIYTGRGP